MLVLTLNPCMVHELINLPDLIHFIIMSKTELLHDLVWTHDTFCNATERWVRSVCSSLCRSTRYPLFIYLSLLLYYHILNLKPRWTFLLNMLACRSKCKQIVSSLLHCLLNPTLNVCIRSVLKDDYDMNYLYLYVYVMSMHDAIGRGRGCNRVFRFVGYRFLLASLDIETNCRYSDCATR